MTPDLDTPLWQLVVVACVLWVLGALLWRHERVAARRALRRRSSILGHVGEAQPRAASPDAARLDRDLHRDSGGSARDERRAEHHRVGDAGERPALTDDDVVALARFLTSLPGYDAEKAAQRLGINITPVRRRIQSAASDIIDAERLGRRR